MSIIGKRTLSTVIDRSDWDAVAPAIKAESNRTAPRWTLGDVSAYGNFLHITITVNGNFWKDLDDTFAKYVKDWEKM